MDKAIDKAVRERAGNLCEYCHSPQSFYPERFQIDHIISKQHGGKTDTENLALCCLECNQRKGPNIAGIDAVTNRVVQLFHPRKDRWVEHFAWSGPHLVGRTEVGRTTIAVLNMNRGPRLAVRRTLIDEGVFPPDQDKPQE